jgi:pimeloyl-ACP methyl ester carboxylesterase
VRRLVLAATAIGAPLMLPAHPRVLLKMLNPRRYVDPGYLQRIAPELYGGAMRGDAAAVDLFARHADGGHPRGYRYQILAIFGWTSLPWLWRIGQPTLVMAGRDDPLVPLPNARLLAWLLRDSRLHVVDDGHLFLLTKARETAQAITEFLDETTPAASPAGARRPASPR